MYNCRFVNRADLYTDRVYRPTSFWGRICTSTTEAMSQMNYSNIFLKRMIYLLCCLKDFKRLYIKNLLCIQRCIEKQRKIQLLISTMILEKHPIVTLMCVTNFHFSILLMPVFILCITACLARIDTNWRLLNCIIRSMQTKQINVKWSYENNKTVARKVLKVGNIIYFFNFPSGLGEINKIACNVNIIYTYG